MNANVLLSIHPSSCPVMPIDFGISELKDAVSIRCLRNTFYVDRPFFFFLHPCTYKVSFYCSALFIPFFLFPLLLAFFHVLVDCRSAPGCEPELPLIRLRSRLLLSKLASSRRRTTLQCDQYGRNECIGLRKRPGR